MSENSLLHPDDRFRGKPWAAHARHWNLLGSPLRPTTEDLQRITTAWTTSQPSGPSRQLNVLLLGVTPEYAAWPWAHDYLLTAVDSSDAMIRAVWPGDGANRNALRGDWLRLPFAQESFHLLVTDHGPNVFVGLEPLRALGREMRRVLRADGRGVVRVMVRPEQPDLPERIAQLVWSGEIRNFHELKMRLLITQQEADGRTGVRLGDAWNAFTFLFPDRAALSTRLGCSLETVSTIDAYRDSDSRYWFFSPEELRQAFDDFELQVGPGGDYSLADCCPVFSLTPRS